MAGDREALSAWDLRVDDSPSTDAELLTRLVEHAVLAPSGHNTQPWRFRIEGSSVCVLADRTRGLPVVDPHDRALVISCGCALLHLRLAARRYGREVDVEVLPDPRDEDLLARVTLGDLAPASAEERALAAAIWTRHTNRAPFDDTPLPLSLRSSLVAAALTEGAWLELVVDDDGKSAVADLVAEGDRDQMADRAFRRELASWVVGNRSRRADGIPGYAMGLSDLMSIAGPLVVRTFDMGRSQAAKDRELALGSPALAVLGTEGDGPADWIAAGQAHARVALTVRAAGAWASYLNQPIEVPALRPRLADVIGRTGHPQLLNRVGFGPNARPTPRRAAREVLD